MAFVFAWTYLNPPAPQRAAPPREAGEQPGGAQKPAPPGEMAQGAKLPSGQEPPAATDRPSREAKKVPLEVGDRFRIVANSAGASLSSVFLLQFKESVQDSSRYELLYSAPGQPGIFTLNLEDPDNPNQSLIPPEANWDLQEGPREQRPDSPLVVFTNQVGDLWITKSVFPGDSQRFPAEAPEGDTANYLRVRVEFENRGTEPRAFSYSLYGPAGIDSEDRQAAGADIALAYGTRSQGRGDIAVDHLYGGKVLHKDIHRNVAWVAAANNYFTSILFPLPADGDLHADYVEKGFGDFYPDFHSMEALAQEKYGKPLNAVTAREGADVEDQAYKNVRMGFRSFPITLEPGGRETHDYGLCIGQRSHAELDRFVGLNFHAVNDYGVFGFLVKLFIRLLEFLKAIAFGSWGVAIILLTFIVKLCLHPVNRKSQGGMHRFQKKVQKIKPQMDALKERHGKNRVKYNQEVQKLWKENNINPSQQMAGCLMILFQLPIWWGLYSTLRYAIGLRQADFLYITDLTWPDRLFSLGFELPFLGAHFNLLPILYVILTIVNQQLQPKPEDPQMRAQFRMMTFMMVFFGFIFYQFPSGFMLYIMTSAALGIIESKIIKAELAREELSGGSGGSAGVAVGAPSGAPYGAASKKSGGEARSKGNAGKAGKSGKRRRK
jgi:YidC/Oxa1 family membrane protein insertase